MGHQGFRVIPDPWSDRNFKSNLSSTREGVTISQAFGVYFFYLLGLPEAFLSIRNGCRLGLQIVRSISARNRFLISRQIIHPSQSFLYLRRPRISRASFGVATSPPSSVMMRTAFSAMAALLGVNTPLLIYTASSIPTRTCPPSRKACARLG
jgi:hypothetical protein